MRKSLESIAGLVLAGAATLSGCVTANHKLNDISKIPKARIESLVTQAQTRTYSNGLKSDPTNLDYEETSKIISKYEHLPTQNINLYTSNDQIIKVDLEEGNKPKINYTKLKPKKLDTTGILNSYADEIKSIENSLPLEAARGRRFVIGKTDADTKTGQSNQLSNASGLLGIDVYSTKGNGNFLVEINEITRLDKKLTEEKNYEIKIKFGEESFREKKKRTDNVWVLEGAESAGLGFLAGGYSAAGGAVAEHLVGGIWGYFEGREAPKDTFMVENRTNLGKLEQRTSDTFSTLKQSKELGATGLITIPYISEDNMEIGTAMVYVGNPIDVKTGDDGGLVITTNEKGANHLKMLLLRTLKTATRISCSGGNGGSKTIKKPCEPGHGGGQGGGPGGNSGSGGGGQGSSGGGS